MKQGKFRFGAVLACALRAGSPVVVGLGLLLGAPGGAPTAYAQKPSHAKSKHKKPKAHGKSHHHASSSAKGDAKTSAHVNAASTASSGGSGAIAGAAAGPAGAIAGARSPIELRLPIQRVTLDNGLRVVMSVDRTSPTVAVSVVYDVGSRNEVKGRSGFAHLFEHMMFQGSANLPKGEHERLATSRGGHAGGGTGTDVTVFFGTFPAGELALALWLEADRMRSLDVSEENLANQRSVVLEESRGYLSTAFGPSTDRVDELVFQGYWPHEHPTGGLAADVEAAKLDWVKEFHARYYGPNNAALAIAGDFEPDEAMTLVHKHFGGIPRIQVAPFEDPGLPEQTSQRTAVLRSDQARTPEVRYAWAIPPSRDRDRYAVNLGTYVLAEGESSRLYQTLVRDKALAQDVYTSLSVLSRGPGSLTVVAKLREGAKVGDVEKIIEDELRRFSKAPPSEAEMLKAQRRARSKFLLVSVQELTQRATNLGAFEVMFGSALHLNEELPRISAVTREDVQRAVNQYLGPTRRTIVETYPIELAPPAPRATAHAAVSGKQEKQEKKDAPKAATSKKHSSKSSASKQTADTKKKAASGAKPKKPKKP